LYGFTKNEEIYYNKLAIMFTHITFKKLIQSELAFFSSLYGLILFTFYNAFHINFFADDYFFLQISRAHTIGDFIHFYSPIRDYSYKPLASETFYFILHLLNNNVFLGHLIMFVTYFVGLFYLYKIIILLTNNKYLAKLTVFMYGVSFVHVFQLYWFGTYQEIALFCFLTISFYHFVRKKYALSILFFVFASLCKETAALYAPFLFLFTFFRDKGKFWFIYKTSLDHITTLDNYKINWNLKLLMNNSMWYGLWGIGFPNFMSDYFSSIFSKPSPVFWDIIKSHDIKIYFDQLIIYLLLFTCSLMGYLFFNKKELKKYTFLLIFSLFGFLLFLGPILLFPHKWMIRLTMPLIFVSLFQANFIFDLFRKNLLTKAIAIILIVLYFSWNFYGIKTHESSSLYLLENDIYIKSSRYFLTHKNKIENKRYVFFKDDTKNKSNIFKNSQKLKLSFHDQSFLDHFFPSYKLTAVYNFESSKIPPNAFIVDTNLLFN